MSTPKRGLGRGLEALLTEVSSIPKPTETSLEIEAQVDMAMTLIKAIQKEHSALLKEVENIHEFLVEFEAMVHRL